MKATNGTARDQATRLRELVRGDRPRTARTIAVTSGKGGVGKSNIAVNLSISLAARGRRVTLVDADLGLANADLLLGVQPRYTLSHAMTGSRSLEAICVSAPGGVRFVPGASGLGSLADMSEFDRHQLLRALQDLESSTDIVVFDCGAGIARNVLSFALAADTVLVVTTPQPPAITDAYATIKVLHGENVQGTVGLFVNQAEHRRVAARTFERVRDVAAKFLRFSVADFGCMLQDSVVARAVEQRSPFVLRYPTSNASASIAALADRLLRENATATAPEGFFRRVVGLFA